MKSIPLRPIPSHSELDNLALEVWQRSNELLSKLSGQLSESAEKSKLLLETESDALQKFDRSSELLGTRLDMLQLLFRKLTELLPFFMQLSEDFRAQRTASERNAAECAAMRNEYMAMKTEFLRLRSQLEQFNASSA